MCGLEDGEGSGPREVPLETDSSHGGLRELGLSSLPQLHLLHGWPVLHQQDLLHAVPGNSASAHTSQGHWQGQEEKLTPSDE